jgi:hypothetical protein
LFEKTESARNGAPKNHFQGQKYKISRMEVYMIKRTLYFLCVTIFSVSVWAGCKPGHISVYGTTAEWPPVL